MMKKNCMGIFNSPIRAKVGFLEEINPKYE